MRANLVLAISKIFRDIHLDTGVVDNFLIDRFPHAVLGAIEGSSIFSLASAESFTCSLGLDLDLPLRFLGLQILSSRLKEAVLLAWSPKARSLSYGH